MTDDEVEAAARRYLEVHGEWAWLEAGLIADRHYAAANVEQFRNWARVAQRLDVLLPWVVARD